jgi:hypothetical protein
LASVQQVTGWEIKIIHDWRKDRQFFITDLSPKGDAMVKKPDFDLQEAHRYFSAECFNRAWDYIDKPARTREEEESMLMLGLTSLWHWKQRLDMTKVNLSIGCWQVARIYALLGRVDESRWYAQASLDALQGEGDLPFYKGYAYEAMARAEAVAGNLSKMNENKALSENEAARVHDQKDRKALLDDLATIKSS